MSHCYYLVAAQIFNFINGHRDTVICKRNKFRPNADFDLAA